VSYLFFYSDTTERECLWNSLFSNTSRFWDDARARGPVPTAERVAMIGNF